MRLIIVQGKYSAEDSCYADCQESHADVCTVGANAVPYNILSCNRNIFTGINVGELTAIDLPDY